MSVEKVLKGYFNIIYQEDGFVEKTYEILKRFGFTPENTIACVDVCRDEISQPFLTCVKERWGEAFNLCSLAGMFFAGKTAILAAMHHAPIVGGKERYVFYALPHIAIDDDGQIGRCRRRGREEDSNACGALNVFLSELRKGKINLTMDSEDVELSLIRTRLLKEIPFGHIPDLLELTKITLKTIKEDFKSTLDRVVNKERSDYAFITGIQIHTKDGNYVAPDESFAVVNKKKKLLSF